MHVNCRSIKNEDHYNKLVGFLHVPHSSIFEVTETRLSDPCILPPFENYNVYHRSRPTQRGDGVTLLINKIFDSHDLYLKFVPKTKTFEFSCKCISAGASSVVCVGVYKPPSTNKELF